MNSKLFTFFVLLLISIQVHGESQGVFQLKLRNFQNNLGRDAQGKCCSGFRTQSGSCSEPCSTRFRVCLKHYQKTVDPQDGCTFGESFTPLLGNNVVNFDIIQFPLNFKWPGTFSLIIEAWHENNKTEGKNSLISRLATQNQLDAGEDWTHGIHQESQTKLEYEYRMVCSSHYFGKDCDTLCRPRDDQFGHYVCGANGEKICLDGWQKDPSNPEGDYCTSAKCLDGCHSEHGECDRPGQCRCKTGWTGRYCDQCVRYPGCIHGSCEMPFECICNEGWGGLFCNQDLNYCTNHRPCKNGATCRNTGQGSYTCSCPPGYTGTNCESRISNECEHQPCLNGGTCQGSGINDYTCVCPLGFHGRHCEMYAQTCDDKPCKNGAQCRNLLNGGYQCTCPSEYQGVNCDVKIDHCRATPCQNGGTCQLLPDNEGYQCRCPSGFSGQNCEINVDDCAQNPCQNGGTCFDFVNDYKCYCHAGFMGKNCEHNVDDCSTNPCANGGTCHDAINNFVCTCKPGFTGKDCSQEVNECLSSPCLQGFCIDKLNDFECKCLPGYSGKHCNIAPNGSVMKISGEPVDSNEDQWAVIVTCSVVIPLLVIIAVLYLLCNKRRMRREQERADAEARKENELNTVNCINKTKMLDDHMIVNSLDFPKQKNNHNITDEQLFKAKESSYSHKQINTDGFSSSNCSSATRATSTYLCDSTPSSASSSPSCKANGLIYDKPRLSNLPSAARRGLGYNECSSSASTVSSSGNSSVCSSSDMHSTKSKEYGLPTASSINSMAHASKSNKAGKPMFYTTTTAESGKSKFSKDLFATEV